MQRPLTEKERACFGCTLPDCVPENRRCQQIILERMKRRERKNRKEAGQ